MRIYFLLLICCLVSINITAQQLDNSNIMLFDFSQKSDSSYVFKNPKFLTGFNKDGYNNQPHFMSNDELYITVQKPKDTTQTDIYSLNLSSNKLTQVTATVESEYSPTKVPSPGGVKSYEFSCVRVELDSTQRLWKFPVNRTGNGSRVFNNITKIGYHFWVDYRDLVLFLVEEPHKLMVADSRDESARYITSNIGRCFQELPNGEVAYVEKMSADTWLLKKLNTRTYFTSLITAIPFPNVEDFAILNDGTIIMANGSRLYKFNQRKDINWLEIANLGYYGMRNITRIAVNDAGDKIALVIK